MSRRSTIRLVIAVVLLAIVVAGFVVLNRHGDELPQWGARVREWVKDHRVVAPLALLAAYLVCAFFLLPVWWVQILAGYGFGLFWAILLCDLCATISAVVVLPVSRWLGADWFHNSVEGKIQKLKRVDEMMGHNGLLSVMFARLCHVIPFGLCNYAFGIVGISTRDVLVGTLLGSVPAIAFYVALGAHPALIKTWEFWTKLAAVQVVLLVPLAVRYWKPRRSKERGGE